MRPWSPRPDGDEGRRGAQRTQRGALGGEGWRLSRCFSQRSSCRAASVGAAVAWLGGQAARLGPGCQDGPGTERGRPMDARRRRADLGCVQGPPRRGGLCPARGGPVPRVAGLCWWSRTACAGGRVSGLSADVLGLRPSHAHKGRQCFL